MNTRNRSMMIWYKYSREPLVFIKARSRVTGAYWTTPSWERIFSKVNLNTWSRKSFNKLSKKRKQRLTELLVIHLIKLNPSWIATVKTHKFRLLLHLQNLINLRKRRERSLRLWSESPSNFVWSWETLISYSKISSGYSKNIKLKNFLSRNSNLLLWLVNLMIGSFPTRSFKTTLSNFIKIQLEQRHSKKL